MYKYGNKSFFDFDQGLKLLLRLNDSDDFFYNIPLQGAQVLATKKNQIRIYLLIYCTYINKYIIFAATVLRCIRLS